MSAAANMAKYRAANREKLRLKQASYAAANREKLRLKQASYAAVNRDTIGAKNRRWRAANPGYFATVGRLRVTGLNTLYVHDLLVKNGWVNPPQELIELKRVQLQIKRHIKQESK